MHQAGNGLRLVEEVLLWQIAQTEVLPPARLVFAPMPVEQVREQPPPVLFVVLIRERLWNAHQQPLTQGCDALSAVVQFLRRVPILRRRPWHGCARRLQVSSELFQPVSKAKGGDAVILVVAFDGLPDFYRNRVRALQLKRLLHHEQRSIGIDQRNGAVEAVEHFQVLDRVALDPGAQALPHHSIEVNEAFGAEHLVQLLLARRVSTHQPLEGRRLIRGVVIDVHRFVLLRRLHNEIDYRLEGLALIVFIECPEASVDRRAVRLNRHHAEEVFAPSLSGKEIALEIEEHIAGRRLGQSTQPFPNLAGPKFIKGRRLAARVELDAGLLANSDVRLDGPAFRFERERQRQFRQSRKRRHLSGLKFSSLEP